MKDWLLMFLLFITYNPELEGLFSTFMDVISRERVLEKLNHESMAVIERSRNDPNLNPIDEVLQVTNKILFPDIPNLQFLSVPRDREV